MRRHRLLLLLLLVLQKMMKRKMRKRSMPMRKFPVGGIEVVYVSSPLLMRTRHCCPMVVGTQAIIEVFNNPHNNSCPQVE
jgi:hypothetical protein